MRGVGDVQWCAVGGMGAVLAQPSVPLGSGDGWGLRRGRGPLLLVLRAPLCQRLQGRQRWVLLLRGSELTG